MLISTTIGIIHRASVSAACMRGQFPWQLSIHNAADYPQFIYHLHSFFFLSCLYGSLLSVTRQPTDFFLRQLAAMWHAWMNNWISCYVIGAACCSGVWRRATGNHVVQKGINHKFWYVQCASCSLLQKNVTGLCLFHTLEILKLPRRKVRLRVTNSLYALRAISC